MKGFTIKKVAFIVDSSFSAGDDFYKKEGMYRVYFGITDSEGNDFLDNTTSLSTKDIIAKFNKGLSFKSNAVSPGQVLGILEEIIDKYDYVICFTLSGGLSSYFANIQFLSGEENYKKKLFIVDSKEVGYSEFALIKQSIELLEKGKSIEQVLEFTDSYYLKNYTAFNCETWTHLMKSGRVPKIVSVSFNKMKIFPIISLYKKNNLAGLARSFEKVVAKIILDFKKLFDFKSADSIEHVVIYDNFISKEKVNYIEDQIYRILNFPKDKILKMPCPNLVLIYTGLGSFGIHIRSKNSRK